MEGTKDSADGPTKSKLEKYLLFRSVKLKNTCGFFAEARVFTIFNISTIKSLILTDIFYFFPFTLLSAKAPHN